MADGKGTDSDSENGGWYLVQEAECADDDSLEELFDASTAESSFSDFIDDEGDEPDQGNYMRLLQEQQHAETRQQLSELKRKYNPTPSPTNKVNDLSPRLQAVHITPPKKNSKRRLFEDSGIEGSMTNGIEDSFTAIQVESQNGVSDSVLEILKASNSEILILSKFKAGFGVGFKDLTRSYKSDKTCCTDWVAFVFGVREEVLEASKSTLQQYCEFFQLTIKVGVLGNMALYLFCFKSTKCRETLAKQLCALLCVQPQQIMAQPPKNRSVPVALYFYKGSTHADTFKFGDFPAWLSKQTLLSHQGADTFELSNMIQWAYDMDYTDEAEIAFNYAQEADHDPNAAAWLRSNAQAKYVKDCCRMVRMYKKQEAREMSMSQWIYKCCSKVQDEGDWTEILRFLKFQEVNVVCFLGALRHLINGTPKKHCILIHGPSNTGKSTFCFNLIHFLKGGVVSFLNSRSQFWLTPLTDAKFGYLDDATDACLSFLDTHMRSAFDGNPVSVDLKHCHPVQVKLPPMLMTSNVDITQKPQYLYLSSRMMTFAFPKPFPFNTDGTPIFSLTCRSWKAFFKKCYRQLGLDPEEEVNDGGTERTFRCTARSPDGSY
ncbi:E1 [Leptonychotes weddellii papillomavirus 5]|uniref:Replication protein E1 n=1 Tax=Leptonychotes weddellii papillomavirus 5 TaxID=2077306 RepID=A0A2I8B2T9_9PAPI|nr:E1 [Leptonychotes weddellii papillomavirus 5]AUT11919.1 E1 [Leptonychotes weddellii papillomavirus 5]